MKKIEFYKLQASGNDFILIDNRKIKLSTSGLKSLARRLSERKISVGADGMLVVDYSRRGDFKMRIINADGSEAEMCGNGARCAALWYKEIDRKPVNMTFETIAGIIKAKVINAKVIKVGLTDAFGLKLGIPLKIFGRNIHVDFINVGVPHTIVFVQGLNNIDINEIGRAIRFHKKFVPAGTNVNFVEVNSKSSISIRTYERGVEAETLACGTGSVASAIISGLKICGPGIGLNMSVKTRGGEVLKVYFHYKNNKVSDIFLEGMANFVYKGEIKL